MTNIISNIKGKMLRGIFFPFGILYFRVFLKVRIIGKENIPKKGCFFALNHTSHLDWCIIYTIFRMQYGMNISFIANQYLLNHALFKHFLPGTKIITTDYSLSSIKNAYKEVEKRLRKKNIIGIFPEGTRSHNGRLQEARDGIADILFHINVPVVPIGLKGFYEALPRHKKFPGFSRCTIKIGKPLRFRVEDYANRRQAKDIILTIIMHEIAKLTGDRYDYAPAIRKRSDENRSSQSHACRRQDKE